MKPSFFLNSLTIENFKAVRSSGTVKLSPLTVFIGNNGSGKYSLIEGLETYQATVIRGLDAAIERWLGLNTCGTKAPATIGRISALKMKPMKIR